MVINSNNEPIPINPNNHWGNPLAIHIPGVGLIMHHTILSSPLLTQIAPLQNPIQNGFIQDNGSILNDDGSYLLLNTACSCGGNKGSSNSGQLPTIANMRGNTGWGSPIRNGLETKALPHPPPFGDILDPTGNNGFGSNSFGDASGGDPHSGWGSNGVVDPGNWTGPGPYSGGGGGGGQSGGDQTGDEDFKKALEAQKKLLEEARKSWQDATKFDAFGKNQGELFKGSLEEIYFSSEDLKIDLITNNALLLILINFVIGNLPAGILGMIGSPTLDIISRSIVSAGGGAFSLSTLPKVMDLIRKILHAVNDLQRQFVKMQMAQNFLKKQNPCIQLVVCAAARRDLVNSKEQIAKDLALLNALVDALKMIPKIR